MLGKSPFVWPAHSYQDKQPHRLAVKAAYYDPYVRFLFSGDLQWLYCEFHPEESELFYITCIT